ncbi:hypothetical protein GCM10027048_20790 [Hymenobacter coalescens]
MQEKIQGTWVGYDRADGGSYTFYRLAVNNNRYAAWRVTTRTENEPPSWSDQPDETGTLTLGPVSTYTNTSSQYRNILFTRDGGDATNTSLFSRVLSNTILINESGHLEVAGWSAMDRKSASADVPAANVSAYNGADGEEHVEQGPPVEIISSFPVQSNSRTLTNEADETEGPAPVTQASSDEESVTVPASASTVTPDNLIPVTYDGYQTTFKGLIGSEPATYRLHVNDAGIVKGEYYLDKQPRKTFSLDGHQHPNGALELSVYDADGTESAYWDLEMGDSCFTGKVVNTDSSNMPISICK